MINELLKFDYSKVGENVMMFNFKNQIFVWNDYGMIFLDGIMNICFWVYLKL